MPSLQQLVNLSLDDNAMIRDYASPQLRGLGLSCNVTCRSGFPGNTPKIAMCNFEVGSTSDCSGKRQHPPVVAQPTI